jgi:chitodextrinase
MHQLSVGISVLAFGMAACTGQTPTSPAPVASQIVTAPTQVTVSGKQLRLTTNL